MAFFILGSLRQSGKKGLKKAQVWPMALIAHITQMHTHNTFTHACTHLNMYTYTKYIHPLIHSSTHTYVIQGVLEKGIFLIVNMIVCVMVYKKVEIVPKDNLQLCF